MLKLAKKYFQIAEKQTNKQTQLSGLITAKIVTTKNSANQFLESWMLELEKISYRLGSRNTSSSKIAGKYSATPHGYRNQIQIRE